MAVLIHPLSVLVSRTASSDSADEAERFPSLQRDAWYNLVLHGFGLRSTLGRRHIRDLEILAYYSEPLVPADRESAVESPIELNMILKRGSSSHQGVERLREEMAELLPSCGGDINRLDYSEVVFLKAAHLVETLRARASDCTQILVYFVEPRLQGSTLGRCMRAVASSTTEATIRQVFNIHEDSMTALSLGDQLSIMFQSCCHRSPRVQETAYLTADRIIEQIPSALCQKRPLFALLDLLTMMWSSCLEAETHEYEWQNSMSTSTGTKVALSDDFDLRNKTLRALHGRSKEWVLKALNTAPLDVKGLLQVSGVCASMLCFLIALDLSFKLSRRRRIRSHISGTVIRKRNGRSHTSNRSALV